MPDQLHPYFAGADGPHDDGQPFAGHPGIDPPDPRRCPSPSDAGSI